MNNALKTTQDIALNSETEEHPYTQLQLTKERTPRFVEAAKAGVPIPEDIAQSLMAQLFSQDSQRANKESKETMKNIVKLTEDQLNRLNAAQAAGEPVPVDIRELVITNYGFDGSESEEIIAEAARNLGTTIHDIFRETLDRHGMDSNIVFNDE